MMNSHSIYKCTKFQNKKCNILAEISFGVDRKTSKFPTVTVTVAEFFSSFCFVVMSTD